MRPPEELLLRYLLPNIRGILAHTLRKKGFSQSKIAFVLGVSQAAVSYYLSKHPTNYAEALRSYGVPREETETLINSIVAAASEGPEGATRALMNGWQRLLTSGTLCQLHRKIYPELGDCTICITKPTISFIEREGIIRDIERAVLLIERSPELLKVYPEVSINVALAREGASSLEDVAAIPGRIVRINDRLVAVGKPEFGASKHLASILLGVTRVNPLKRAVINIRLVPGLEEAAKRLGLKFAKTQAKQLARTEEEVVFSVIELVSSEKDLDLVIDEGGLGLEPAVYCFDTTAEGAAKKAVALSRAIP
jgi:predicted fused transcriptional regulator/phosphomethylpyrimidine kinase/predicted transcriptional regulator